jgi:hypothetical protein
LSEINKIVEELEKLIENYYPKAQELKNFYMNTIFASILSDEERVKTFKKSVLPIIPQLAIRFTNIAEQLQAIGEKLKRILNISEENLGNI